MKVWTAVFKDPDGIVVDNVSGTPEDVAEKARQFILNMIGDEESSLACSVEVWEVVEP